MIFEKYLMPDLVLPTFDFVTPEMLTKNGKKLIICDVDNTLATYEQPEPPPAVVGWIRSMHDCGIAVAFVSNNNGDRLTRFNASLGCLAYSGAKKPSPKALYQAFADAGVTADEAVMLGDQLLTDTWAAKRAGIPAIVVPPIKDRTSAFFRFKRWLEKPYMRKYARKYGHKTEL